MTAKTSAELRLAVATKHAQRAREATAARDAAIRRCRDAGATLRAIGEAVGMSHGGVAKIAAHSSSSSSSELDESRRKR